MAAWQPPRKRFSNLGTVKGRTASPGNQSNGTLAEDCFPILLISENSGRALNYAISATTEYKAELTLLHVWGEKPANTDQAMAATAQELERLIPTELRQTLNTRFALRVGKPYKQLVEFAKETHPDIVAMGVRDRGSLERSSS